MLYSHQGHEGEGEGGPQAVAVAQGDAALSTVSNPVFASGGVAMAVATAVPLTNVAAGVGEWAEYWSEEHRQPYWSQHTTGELTWEPPTTSVRGLAATFEVETLTGGAREHAREPPKKKKHTDV